MRLFYDLIESSSSADSMETRDDVTVSDIEEDWDFNICRGQNSNAVEVSEGLVEVYPEVMTRETKENFGEFIRSEKNSGEDLERPDVEEEVKSLEEMSKDDIDSTFTYFEDILPRRHRFLFKSCLYLQHAKKSAGIELDKPIQVYKGDLRDDFGYVAIYMNHLVSSGYFNEGGYFREMYSELCQRKSDPDERYRDEFEIIIENELIALYVNDEDTSEKVAHGIRGLLSHYFRYNPYQSFTDIRGIGEECEESIDEGLDMVQEEYSNLLTQELESDEETAIRLFPDSISMFNSN